MTKIGILETISFKQRRVKFEGQWISVDPLLNLDPLVFGKKYEATFDRFKEEWFISEFREVKK